MLLGSHVSMSGKDMLLASAKEAVKYGANTFMIYTGAPQNTRRKNTDHMNIPEANKYMEKNNISNIVVHAPYIVNLGNTKKAHNFNFAVQFLRDEVKRAVALGAKQITLHPGSHVGAGDKEALANIAKGLDKILDPKDPVQIALETMAGKGTEVGRSFEQLEWIIEHSRRSDKLSVTFDTCHTNDAGYDIKNDLDGVLNEFDHIIGLDRLKVIHVNDSKNGRGSHKDRHENIGCGTIGFKALNKLVHHPQLMQVPKILETPYVGPQKNDQYPPYAYEIKMLHDEHFDSDIKEHIYKNKGKLD